jgi:hypothetical protein
VGEEGQRGRRPLRRERAKPLDREALGFRGHVIGRSRGLKDEREDSRREFLGECQVGGEPQRSELQESRASDPD